MKKGYTKIGVVLDRSLSMRRIQNDTIEGFNAFLKEQKNAEGEASLTLAQFDDQYDIVYNDINIKDVRPLTRETFVPRGNTALYDAVCKTIDNIGQELANLRPSSRPEKVIIVIITDGEENVSRKFSVEDVRQKIKHQTNVYGWEFVFLAANQDAMETAGRFNIAKGNAMTYGLGAESVSNVYITMGKKMADVRSGVGASMAYTVQERLEQEELNKKN